LRILKVIENQGGTTELPFVPCGWKVFLLFSDSHGEVV
jgi:hypothetical protein